MYSYNTIIQWTVKPGGLSLQMIVVAGLTVSTSEIIMKAMILHMVVRYRVPGYHSNEQEGQIQGFYQSNYAALT